MLINIYIILLMGVTLAVVLSRRTMYAILFLILLFSLVAVFVYSLGVDFIGLIFVIVYVGAIATLFLFIVMMLGGEDWEPRAALTLETQQLLHASGYIGSRWITLLTKLYWYSKHVVFDILVAFGFGLSLLSLFSNVITASFPAWLDVVQTSYRTNMFNTSFLYGVFFYDHWYLPFLVAGVVLLIAMLGSIILTTRLLLPAGTDSKPSHLNPPTLSDDERKRVLIEPSPLLAKVVEK